MRALVTAFTLLGAALLAAPCRAEAITDLSGIVVGMLIKDLPTTGYRDFACAMGAGKPLAGWSEWKNCPSESGGLHALRVGYDQPGREGTFIAGHPVNLTMFFNNEAQLVQVLIETDAHAPLYLRKKAYLLGQQAKYRYGENQWECREMKLAADERPLGPTLIKEHCSKKLADREVVIDRSLFRKLGSDPKNFVSETRIYIHRLSKQG